jgi:hypothetical protein
MQSQLFHVSLTLDELNQPNAGSTDLPTPKEVAAPAKSFSIEDTQRLESRKQIVFMIQDTPVRSLLMQNNTVVFGRIDPHTKLRPDMDLTRYGGEEYGVSRTHCSILFKNNTLYLTDLGSSNGTFLNGRRLRPNRTEEVIIGDVFTLGELRIELMLPTV